jgi:hypothetical protein
MSDSEKTPGELPEHPKGALVITLLYFAMVISGWCFMYFTLIGRGATQ